MEHIQWRKVTWYSKTFAMIVFIVFPFLGFYWGIHYGEAIQQANQASQMVAAQSQGNTAGGSDYYANTGEWQVGQSLNGRFSIAYPIDFEVNQINNTAPSTDWRLNANGALGNTFYTITIPAAFEPQTNFNEAKLTVGASRNTAAIAQCLVQDPGDGPSATTTKQTINGTSFIVAKSFGVGAGNYYQTTSYRTLHAGQCYAVEYTIHSSQIDNYPAEYNLKPFNQNQIESVLQRIVGTFKFL
jgi:hypothetical protein